VPLGAFDQQQQDFQVAQQQAATGDSAPLPLRTQEQPLEQQQQGAPLSLTLDPSAAPSPHSHPLPGDETPLDNDQHWDSWDPALDRQGSAARSSQQGSAAQASSDQGYSSSSAWAPHHHQQQQEVMGLEGQQQQQQQQQQGEEEGAMEYVGASLEVSTAQHPHQQAGVALHAQHQEQQGEWDQETSPSSAAAAMAAAAAAAPSAGSHLVRGLSVSSHESASHSVSTLGLGVTPASLAPPEALLTLPGSLVTPASQASVDDGAAWVEAGLQFEVSSASGVEGLTPRQPHAQQQQELEGVSGADEDQWVPRVQYVKLQKKLEAAKVGDACCIEEGRSICCV